ncbi:MAG TPA: hypothetical protein VFU57_11195, partial [Candidatus Acidoferrales bacterium]|nr:hypothetical protein [Candidatus Acidoferrales bacterium]
MRKLSRVLVIFVFAAAILPVAARAQSEADLNAIYKIKDIGFNHSQVMDIMSYLTDVYGPRLTNSPNMRAAAQWTEDEMKQWGLANVHTEPWKFGRGWSNERFSAMMISPRPYILIAYPLAWTPGTNGSVTAEAVWAPIASEADFNKYRGQLKGKFVLTQVPPEDPLHFDAQAHRYSDAELQEMQEQPIPGARNVDRFAQFRAFRALQEKIRAFLAEEGVAGWIQPSRGDDGTVYVQSGGSYEAGAPAVPAGIAMASECYGRI